MMLSASALAATLGKLTRLITVRDKAYGLIIDCRRREKERQWVGLGIVSTPTTAAENRSQVCNFGTPL